MTREDIITYAQKTYAVEPEYLWKKSPKDFVLRRQDNRRWFAVMMSVPAVRLGLPEVGETDVMNVKCGPILLGSYRGMPGFLPAYHMNKENWLTVVLDIATQKDIEELLALSYNLVK